MSESRSKPLADETPKPLQGNSPVRGDNPAQRDVLTIEEAAELLGVSVKTFNKVLHSENIPGRKIGREWKFSRQALIDWIGAGRSDDFYREPGTLKAAPNGRTPSQGEAPGARRTSGWRVKLD